MRLAHFAVLLEVTLPVDAFDTLCYVAWGHLTIGHVWYTLHELALPVDMFGILCIFT